MSDQMSAGEVPAVDEHQFPVGPSVGAQLRAAREAAGIQLQEAASTLKLGLRQVDALENGDWQVLPGHTFIRGFVRNYARMLRIDPAPLMAQLDTVLEKPVTNLGKDDASAAPMPQSGGSMSGRDRHVLIVGAALVLLAGLIYFLLPNDLSALRESAQQWMDKISRKEAPPPVVEAAPEPVFPPGSTPQQVMNPQAETPKPTPAVQEQAAPATAPAPLSPAAVAPEEKSVVASAAQLRFFFDKESWLEVRDRDNKVLFGQRVAAGTEQTLAGEGPMTIKIGYAPGVRVFWHGQPVDLVPHTRGDVARLVLE
jgi:cytoskeleton protein RodZ